MTLQNSYILPLLKKKAEPPRSRRKAALKARQLIKQSCIENLVDHDSVVNWGEELNAILFTNSIINLSVFCVHLIELLSIACARRGRYRIFVNPVVACSTVDIVHFDS